MAGIVVLVAFKSRIAALALVIALVAGAQTVYPAFLAAREGQTLTTGDMLGLIESEQSRAAVARHPWRSSPHFRSSGSDSVSSNS